MAWLGGDGFDLCGNSNDIALNVIDWSSVVNNVLSAAVNTRFGVGNCISLASGASLLSLTSTTFANSTTIYVNFALTLIGDTFSSGGTTVKAGFILKDGANNQVGVWWRNGGDLIVTNGLLGGTILATSSAFLNAGNFTNWHQYQVKVVINNTTGTVEMRMDGAATDTFSSGSIDTRNGSSNNYCNVMNFNGNTINGGKMDDIFWFNDQGAAPNTWAGDVRCVQLMPNNDSGTQQWTRTGGTALTVGDATTGSNAAMVTGTAYSVGLTTTPTQQQVGTLPSVVVNFTAGFTGNAKCALYTVSGTTITLVTNGVSNQVTNPATGSNTFTFATPPQIVRGLSYLLFVTTDASATSSGKATGTKYTFSMTYGSGFPSSATITSGGTANTPSISGAITVANAAAVSELLEDADTSYVATNTASNADLYLCDALSSTPNAVVCVQQKFFYRMDDAGPHTVKQQMKSGATTVNGTTMSCSTSYQMQTDVYATDPNTSAAWTAGAVNALQIGPVDVT
jgi:hypothetical protein